MKLVHTTPSVEGTGAHLFARPDNPRTARSAGTPGEQDAAPAGSGSIRDQVVGWLVIFGLGVVFWLLVAEWLLQSAVELTGGAL